jgi:hypothetical protein
MKELKGELKDDLDFDDEDLIPAGAKSSILVD